MVDDKKDIDELYHSLNEKDKEIKNLKLELDDVKQINSKTKDYLLMLESKIVEFDKQKEIINSLNSQINQLKTEINEKNNEIQALKQELESTKLTEEYIIKMLDLRKSLDKF